MVGAWPTHLDIESRGGEFLQAVVDGVPQALPTNVLPSPSANSGSAAPGSVNVSGSGSGSGGSPAAAGTGLFTGVVFRGRLGGDRAVRANVPFPWMATMNRPTGCGTFEPGENDFSFGCIVEASLSRHEPLVEMHYPDSIIAHVKADAPFAWLWPGHAVAKGREDGSRATAAEDCDGGGGGAAATTVGRGSGSGGGTASGLAAGSDGNEELRLEREWMPSSGQTACFHAGHTAYFEITLGETMAPLEQPQGAELEMEPCVAIGLVTDSFDLE